MAEAGFWLTGATLRDGTRADLHLAAGRIAAIGAAEGAAPRHDVSGFLCLPALVEGHVHLDKTFLGCPWQPHLPGNGIADRIRLEKVARARIDVPVEERGARLLDLSIAAGAGHLRSHVDIDPDWGLSNLDAVLRLREAQAARIGIQVVAFPQSGILRAPGTEALLDEALERGADLIGGLDPAGIDGDAVRHLDIVFGLAAKHRKGVDIHLHDAGALGCHELSLIAERTREHGLEGRVAVSHAFCLGESDPALFDRTAKALAGARVAIMTSVPGGAMPPLRRLREAGVVVFGGSDNIRDAWSPHGNGDILERATFAATRQDFRGEAELALALDLVTGNGAVALGLSGYGIAPGHDADLLLIEAETAAEAVCARPRRRVTLKRGRVVAGTLPGA